MLHRIPALLASFVVLSLAMAQDPSKNPRYEEFRKAKIVVVAKLEAAKVTAVLESFPPQYRYQLTIRASEVHRGEIEKGKAVTCSFGITSENEPKLPVGKEVLVQLESIRQGAFRVVKMEEPTAELKAVAKAAAGAGKAEDERNEELSRKEPERHPRFKGFKEAAGIAVVALDENGAAASDGRVTIYDMKATDVLKGDLKVGKFRGQASIAMKLPAVPRWLVTYRLEDGKVHLVAVDEATDSLLRVARAAVAK